MRLASLVSIMLFQSTHPVRGATIAGEDHVFLVEISIHAPREGCDPTGPVFLGYEPISIHAPREGCDWRLSGSSTCFHYFNPRTP